MRTLIDAVQIKNICQTCLLDLEYNLPVQARDTALAIKSEAPTSEINREWYAQNAEGKVSVTYGILSAVLTSDL
jgi:pre-mRNA-splicing factor RBM22/SLT11